MAIFKRTDPALFAGLDEALGSRPEVLAHGTDKPLDDREPAEADDTWVEAPDGSHWFVHFQDRDAFGRVVHLQPMGWGDDGWPWMGEGGQPVLTWPGLAP